MSKVSIKDIAQLAGVSVATVSRVINHNGRFSKETEEKVLQVIAQTGYQMNYNAKGLRMNRSHTIGIIVPDITNYFFAKLTETIEGELFEKDYSTIICNTAHDPKKEQAYIQTLESKGVDGLIIISGADHFSPHFSQEDHIPYVCIDRAPDKFEETIFISSDHIDGAKKATTYLLKAGVDVPIMISHIRYSNARFHRLEGFKEALAQEGLAFDDQKNLIVYNPEEEEAFRQAILNLLVGEQTYGLFALSDTMAARVQDMLIQAGADMTRFKLVGFDDTPLACLANPAFSSIRQDIDQLAKIGVEKLLGLLQKQNDLGQTITVPVTLVER